MDNTEKKFAYYGYLSDEILQAERQIYTKHKDLFDWAFELNHICQGVKYDLNAHNLDGQEVMSVSAYVKIINGFQALVILARKGMGAEAEILLRTLLEALIILKLLCEDTAFSSEYARKDLLYRKKLLNAAKNNPHGIFESTRELIAKGMLDDVLKEIGELKPTEESIECLAKRAGLSAYYDSIYRITSGPCHTSPRSLERYVVADEKGEIKSFNPGPFHDIDTELHTSMVLVLVSTELMMKLFKIKEPESLTILRDKITKHGSSPA